ncbi:hypothetical protein M0813_29929 [Anaeramoeba flamelloides]|uniref:Uncharacterized protein n=1 Tax=Anaeramoeba flamelloides TaxID=1746091 RepID=A0ABQ8XLW3_9EUKA|nr:hypothetical protein M0813_29929 [Anaeramoeba flamelloides]
MKNDKGWWTWEQILKYVDIICIGCIIFRIMDTMNQLKRASEVGGKNSENLKKLRMFKEFYLVTIGYIYLTRIILIIFEQILPFRFTWLSQFFEELFTFIFYFYVGYRFRPVKDSLYHQLSNSTDSENGQVINLEQINDENETIKRVKHSQDDDFIEDDDGDNMFQKTEEEKNNTSGESNFDEI